MAAQNTNHFGNINFREIHKNAWLKKVNSINKKKRDRLWVVFCVHDDTEAFLEFYADCKIAVLHKPDYYVHLNEIQHVTPTICPQEQEYEFVLTLKSEVVGLTAPTWDQMLDWVTSLQNTLHELKILSPKDNIYSKLPEFSKPHSVSTRDPNSPLPPPPSAPEVLPGTELQPSSAGPRTNITRNWDRSLSQTSSTSDESLSIRRQSTSEPEVFRFDSIANEISEVSTEPENCDYEHLFHGQPGPSNRQLERTQSTLQHAPVSYKTFRELQVLQLQKEMKHSGGVKLQLRKRDCISSIALVNVFDGVWVCGWKQRENPMLYNVLHIGDKILSIAGITVKSATDAYRILESHYCGLYVDIIIKRVPHGQVFLLHRDTEGQSLGIVQENNTAVIQAVEPNSLAARQGLSGKTKTCDGLTFTNWVLTEINGRPLNLFFKKNHIRDRLNSVGKDISILVQPLDLIKLLKRELKALRNYKDYILQ